MKNALRLAALLALASVAPALPRAGTPPPESGAALELLQVTNGFGPLLPHRIHLLDPNGSPTPQVIELRSLEELAANLTPENGVLPPATWAASPLLPTGQGGNHFLAIAFDQPLDVDSLLSDAPSAAAVDQLTGAIRVTAVNSTTGLVFPVRGRAFVGGHTYAGTPVGDPPRLPLQRWYSRGGGALVADPAVDNDGDGVADGLGVPGTEAGTAPFGADLLARANVFVFVADTDGLLTGHETFPPGLEIVVEVTAAVRGASGRSLARTARVTSTVGQTSSSPELRFSPPPGAGPAIEPANGELDVDPLTRVRLGFSEALDLASLGTLPGAGPPSDLGALALSFGPATQRTRVPFHVLPASVYDLSTVELVPAFPFPGTSPKGDANCGAYNRVDVEVVPRQVRDLQGATNQLAVSSFFEAGEGPGLVNAPVAPDAIYAGLRGGTSALSVIDLNGFGQGTGDPTYDVLHPAVEGNTNFPNNPNLRFQGSSLRPPLSVGTCTTDGGSAGVFTRTRDSNLDPELARSPVLLDATDMALGRPLDTSFNGAPAPFGCQSGAGGNLCAIDGLKLLQVTQGGPSTTRPARAPGDPLLNSGVGVGNTISWSPHPNPPPLIYPPLCVAPHIGGQEPTSVESTLPPPDGVGLVNLLVPGDPFGVPAQDFPPSGLLSAEQNAFFRGPSPPQPTIGACRPYMLRQQVGHFLYVVDRARRELVVLNSNRMTPVERIALPDPTSLAMGPNLDLLAVTNQGANRLSFVDVDPSSSTFHQVVQETPTGQSPRGVAWDPMNEDLLVCNEGSDDVTVVSAFSLAVRKVVTIQELHRPFDVVITPRQTNFGAARGVYYGYVLSRNGRLSLFESGPDGVNGWGYDELVGQARYRFRKPKALAVDVQDLRSAVWVAHEGPLDLQQGGQAGPAGTGALTRVFLRTSTTGLLPLVPGSSPHPRQLRMTADVALGASELTGVPTDLAFDDQRNLGSLPSPQGAFSAGTPAAFDGKCLIRQGSGGALPVSAPSHLFVAVPRSSQNLGAGAVDVIELASYSRRDTNAFQSGVQSVSMPGVRVLMNYWRQ